MNDPTSWAHDPDSGSIYCPRWLQPFAMRHVRWWFWIVRLRDKVRAAFRVTGEA